MLCLALITLTKRKNSMLARLLILASLFIPLFVIADEKPKKEKVTGTIEFKGEGKFEADTIATVKLSDVSLQDAPSVTIAEQKIKDIKKFPIAFEVEFDPAKIQPGHEYAIQVRIETKKKLNYINDTRITVISGGKPTKNVKAPVIAVK